MRTKHLSKYLNKYVRVHWFCKGRYKVSFGYFIMRDYYKIVFEDNEGNIIDIPPHTIKYVCETEE